MRKIRTSFTLIEVYNDIISDFDTNEYGYMPYLSSNFGLNFQNYPYPKRPVAISTLTHLENVFKSQNGEVVFKDNYVSKCFEGVLQRYCHQYFVSVEKVYEPWNQEIPSVDDEEVKTESIKQLLNIFQYMNLTAPKYVKLLGLYEAQKDKLMDKLTTEVEAGADTKGTSRFNDTPQEMPSDYDEFEDPDYTTNINISKSHNESSSTTTYDDKNIMARLDEISKLYDNIMRRWIGEFDKFFWEE